MSRMRTATRRDYRERVEAAMAALAARLDEAPDLADLARAAGFSPCWFHRVFLLTVGETPGDFSRRLRLERAAWRLRDSEASVGQIAAEAGFGDQASFTRAFRAAYGAAPGGYRRRPRVQFHLAAPSGAHFDPSGAAPRLAHLAFEKGTMKLETVELESRRYACVRHVGPYNAIGEAFDRLCAAAQPAGLFGLPGADVLAIYHDQPGETPESELRSDAAIFFPDGLALPDGLEEIRLPAGRYVRHPYQGPYEGLGDAWGRLMGNELPEAGFRPDDRPCFEVYVSDPGKLAKEELRTDLYVAVA